MDHLDKKKGIGNACLLIVSSAPIIYYAVHSGIMYNQLKETSCPLQFNEKLEQVDVTKRWR